MSEIDTEVDIPLIGEGRILPGGTWRVRASGSWQDLRFRMELAIEGDGVACSGSDGGPPVQAGRRLAVSTLSGRNTPKLACAVAQEGVSSVHVRYSDGSIKQLDALPCPSIPDVVFFIRVLDSGVKLRSAWASDEKGVVIGYDDGLGRREDF